MKKRRLGSCGRNEGKSLRVGDRMRRQERIGERRAAPICSESVPALESRSPVEPRTIYLKFSFIVALAITYTLW